MFSASVEYTTLFTATVVGRLGGSPTSPTGPVEEGTPLTVLSRSLALAKSSVPPSSEVAFVVNVVAEPADTGRPSRVEGNGSVSRKVGKVGVAGVPGARVLSPVVAIVRSKSVLSHSR